MRPARGRCYDRAGALPPRFILAIGLALVLGGWLAYTSLGGSLETYAGPAELAAGKTYRLNGTVAPGAPKDAVGLANSDQGLTFT